MYFITALTSLEQSNASRCFGYYQSKETALLAVSENWCDLNETIYNYIVVEKIDEGIHPMPEEEMWFQWIQTGEYLVRGNWSQIEKPPETVGFINYAIG